MDRALKERIVGAIVLVVLAVLVVPVFLDGPETEPALITERVALGGQEDSPIKVVVLERDRQTPVPQATTVGNQAVNAAETATTAEAAIELPVPAPAVEEPVAAQTAPADEEPDEKPDTAPAATPDKPRSDPVAAIERSVQSATGMWAVQLGSFSSKPNADKLAADLRRQGFAAFLSETAGTSGALHRVRVGPQKDRPSAEAMLARLRDIDQRGQVVPHP